MNSAAIALIGYLGLLVVIGIWSHSRVRSFGDYVTGGGQIPGWMLALSFMANFISSNSFVGHAGKSYEAGLSWLVLAVIMVICCAISWWWYAPRMAGFARQHHCTTLPDFFEKRFGSPGLATIVNWIVVVATMFYVLAVLRGTAAVVAAGLDLDYPTALLLLYGVTVVYCLLGGLWADVSTDVIQAFVLVAGAVILFVVVAFAPPGAVATRPVQPPPTGLLLALGLAGGAKLIADPKQVMVYYAFRDPAAARRFRWIGPLLLAVVYACLFPLGYLARDLVGDVANVERIVPMLVFEQQIAGAWFGAIFMIALLAASMSSLDSAFLLMGSCLEKHVVAPLTRSEARIGRARMALLAVATLAFALSIRPLAEIIPLTAVAGSLLGAALLPSLTAGLAGVRLPPRAVCASLLAGCVGTASGEWILPLVGVRSPWLQGLFLGLAASIAALFAFRGQQRLDLQGK